MPGSPVQDDVFSKVPSKKEFVKESILDCVEIVLDPFSDIIAEDESPTEVHPEPSAHRTIGIPIDCVPGATCIEEQGAAN
jgi:hypothetical protein